MPRMKSCSTTKPKKDPVYEFTADDRETLRKYGFWLKILATGLILRGKEELMPSKDQSSDFFHQCKCNNPEAFKHDAIENSKESGVPQICAKCSHHYKVVPVNNHRDVCPFENCPCSWCENRVNYRKSQKEKVRIKRKSNAIGKRSHPVWNKRRKAQRKAALKTQASSAHTVEPKIWIDPSIADKRNAGIEIIHPDFPRKIFSNEELEAISNSIKDCQLEKGSKIENWSILLFLKDDLEFNSIISGLISSKVSMIITKPMLREKVLYSAVLNLEIFDEIQILTIIGQFNEGLLTNRWDLHEGERVARNQIKVYFEVDLGSATDIENKGRILKCEMGNIYLELVQFCKTQPTMTKEEYESSAEYIFEKFLLVPKYFLTDTISDNFKDVGLIELTPFTQQIFSTISEIYSHHGTYNVNNADRNVDGALEVFNTENDEQQNCMEFLNFDSPIPNEKEEIFSKIERIRSESVNRENDFNNWTNEEDEPTNLYPQNSYSPSFYTELLTLYDEISNKKDVC